jgi:putative queuosine salvage protein
MAAIVDDIREACAWVAQRARHVRLEPTAIPAYAASLEVIPSDDGADHEVHVTAGSREQRAAFWLTLDAINFGSGWFPTLRKRPGQSGYLTIAAGLTDRFATQGAWSADDLVAIDAQQVAATLGQDPDHELMGLFAASLRDLGSQLAARHGGSFAAAIDAADGSAVTLAQQLSGWACFADQSGYEGRAVPFLKRAQIVGADLHRAGVASFTDLPRLTMFADNLVPHVLRLDGVLAFDRELATRIERGELIEHGSGEEVEIRACALHAVELIAAARPDSCAADIDQLLWLRGGEPRYKARPRHRSRCTAY